MPTRLGCSFLSFERRNGQWCPVGKLSKTEASLKVWLAKRLSKKKKRNMQKIPNAYLLNTFEYELSQVERHGRKVQLLPRRAWWSAVRGSGSERRPRRPQNGDGRSEDPPAFSRGCPSSWRGELSAAGVSESECAARQEGQASKNYAERVRSSREQTLNFNQR